MTYTSSELDDGSKSKPHTALRICSRVSTWRGCAMNISSSVNSVRVSSTGRPARVTSRVARFIVRSAKVRTSSVSADAATAAAYELRRSRARIRANSSSSSNGFTR